MLRVALFPADEDGCGQYRMRLPAAAIQAAGHDIETTFPEKLQIKRSARNLDHIVDAEVDADVVVLQRPARPATVAAIRLLQRRGIAVVVDIDDDLSITHPDSPAFQALHPSNPAENWHHVKTACQHADLVTVSTPALTARWGGRKAVVVPNAISSDLLTVTAERDGRTVGWAGNTHTHVGDLADTAGGVAQAISDTHARFLLIGKSAEHAQKQLGLPDLPDTTGYLPFDEYFHQVARFDVGIVPLKDSAFNRSKSWLKGLEYAALGVPFVASLRPEYQTLADQGIGVTAHRARDWRREIRKLLTDKPYRQHTAEQGRELVAEHHTLGHRADQWADAWQTAFERRQHASRPMVAA